MGRADEVRVFVVDYLERRAREKGLGAISAGDDVHMVNSGLLDSFAFLALLTDVEVHFGIEVDLSGSDPDEFLTIGGLVRLAAGAPAVAGSA
jgi:acyl carrier protein